MQVSYAGSWIPCQIRSDNRLLNSLWNLIRELPSGFWWGFLGAFSANCWRLISFVGHRGHPQRTAVLGDPLYKVGFVVLPFLGGVVAAAYGDPSTIPHPHILPFHLGLSTPAIIKLGTGSISHGNESSN
jgi:hypothetical protein